MARDSKSSLETVIPENRSATFPGMQKVLNRLQKMVKLFLVRWILLVRLLFQFEKVVQSAINVVCHHAEGAVVNSD